MAGDAAVEVFNACSWLLGGSWPSLPYLIDTVYRWRRALSDGRWMRDVALQRLNLGNGFAGCILGALEVVIGL